MDANGGDCGGWGRRWWLGVDRFPARGQFRKMVCAEQGARSLPRHNHDVVVETVPRAPRVARGTAQPWAAGQNPLRGTHIYPEKPQKPQQMPVFIGWNACCPFWPCDMIKRLSAMNSVGRRRKAWGWCRSVCRCGWCVDMAFPSERLLRSSYTPAHNMRDINLLRSLFHRAFLGV